MSIFNDNFEHSPLVIDLTQRVKFHKNHHAGLLENAEQIPSDVPRANVNYYPRDATEKSRANRTVEHDVRQDSIIPFAPGTISPRGVFWLIPDSFQELPDQVQQHPLVGQVFAKFMKNRELERALKIQAQNEPELVEKLKISSSSRLDDQMEMKINNMIQNVIDTADQINSSSGNGDS
jgi:hypothetical protein